MLKKNVKVRSNLKKNIFDIYWVLYQSFFLKSPDLLNYYISGLIKRNIKKVWQIFLILKISLPDFCKVLNIRGVKIQLKGRINGSKRSRIIKIQYGRIPLTTISSDIYYSFNKVMTIHGAYGLKI